jgi:hypothetical protein
VTRVRTLAPSGVTLARLLGPNGAALRRVVGAWIATLGLLAACSHHAPSASLDIVRDSTNLANGSSVLDSAPITVGDFQYKASNGGLRSRWEPMIVLVTVTVTNVSQHAAALNVLSGNCEVLLRVYAHHIPPKKPAYDASDPASRATCPCRTTG